MIFHHMIVSLLCPRLSSKAHGKLFFFVQRNKDTNPYDVQAHVVPVRGINAHGSVVPATRTIARNDQDDFNDY